jgi:hypothetical protein
MNLPGDVKLTCDVEPDAAVDNCAVESEAPTGLGFGAAAVHIASGFKMIAGTLDGVPTKMKFTRHIRFQIPAADPHPAAQVLPNVPEAKMRLAIQMVALEDLKNRETKKAEAALAQMNQELLSSGKLTENTDVAMDAYRQGIQDALAIYIERTAQRAALRMSEGELATSVAFLGSAPGQAWLSQFLGEDAEGEIEYRLNSSEAARKRYCAISSCN